MNLLDTWILYSVTHDDSHLYHFMLQTVAMNY